MRFAAAEMVKATIIIIDSTKVVVLVEFVGGTILINKT